MLFKEKGKWRIEQKRKEGFLTDLTMAIMKESTTSIRKHANKKIVRTAIKKDLSLDLNSLDKAIWGVLKNQSKATLHPNIGSL